MQLLKKEVGAFLILGSLIIGLVGCKEQATNPIRSNPQVENQRVEVTASSSKQQLEGMQPEGSKQQLEEMQPEGSKELQLIMVGDILLHTPVTESGKKADGSYNYSHLFKEVREDIEAADLALVNQEVILGGKELGLSGYPTFNGPYEVGDALVEAGFDVILQATNHALDKGKKGILNTLSFWETKYPHIKVMGIQKSDKKQADKIYVYEKEGIRLAILNYTYGTNGIPLPDGQSHWVNLLKEEQLKKDIAVAKELADFIVVCPHWGTEYTHSASKEQYYWAQLMADEGVDLVLGTHPHVIQPVEWVQGKGGQSMLVYYSLGNFVNSTGESGKGIADRMLGAMAKVTLGRDEKGQVVIKGYGAEALVTHLEKGTKLTTYKLQDYTEDLASKNKIRNQDGTFSLAYCKELWKEVFKDVLDQTEF